MRGRLNQHFAFRIRCWGQRWKTKMQLDAHKSFCRQDTLKLIMSSRLVCLALYSARWWSEACLQQIHRKHAHSNAHRGKSASRKERTECVFKRNSSSSLWHGQQMCGLHCVWQSHMCTPHFHGKVILFSSLQRPQKSAMISSFRKNWFKMGKAESLPSQRILSSLNLENQSWILSIKHLVFLYLCIYSSDFQHMYIYGLYSPPALVFRHHATHILFSKLRWWFDEHQKLLGAGKQNNKRETLILKLEGGWWWWDWRGKLKRMNEQPGLFGQLPRIDQTEGLLIGMRGEKEEFD